MHVSQGTEFPPYLARVLHTAQTGAVRAGLARLAVSALGAADLPTTVNVYLVLVLDSVGA